jgi:hypothetical protein
MRTRSRIEVENSFDVDDSLTFRMEIEKKEHNK